eukprot:scaffold339_cov39-Phaeocystis_antarctica.AAC.1
MWPGVAPQTETDGGSVGGDGGGADSVKLAPGARQGVKVGVDVRQADVAALVVEDVLDRLVHHHHLARRLCGFRFPLGRHPDLVDPVAHAHLL